MSASSFPVALAFAWRPENDGQGDHTDAHDSGGETNRGVTLATWAGAVARGLVGGELRSASVADLTLVLRVDYWRACSCDDLPAGVDLVVFDMAMVAGPGRAARILQARLGVAIDGDVGPITLAAAMCTPSADLVRGLTADDEAYFAGLRAFTWFGRGWDRRAEDARAAGLALIAAA